MKKLLIISFLIACAGISARAQSLSLYTYTWDPYTEDETWHNAPGADLSASLEAGCTWYDGSTGGAVISIIGGASAIFGNSAAVTANYPGYQMSASASVTATNLGGQYILVVWGAYGGWGTVTANTY